MKKNANELKTITLDDIGLMIGKEFYLGTRKSRRIAGFIFKFYKDQILNKKRIRFGEVGKIEVIKKKPREGREPLTGKIHLIPKRLAVTLKKSAAKHDFSGVTSLTKDEFREAFINEFDFSLIECDRLSKLIINLIENIRGNEYRIEVRGFGVFYPSFRKAFIGRNPSTGEDVEKGDRYFTKFKLSPSFRLELENSGNYIF